MVVRSGQNVVLSGHRGHGRRNPLVRGVGPTFSTARQMLMVWALWNASGATLQVVLKRDGASVVCPELRKRFPWVA
jgi:hypothetical protein